MPIIINGETLSDGAIAQELQRLMQEAEQSGCEPQTDIDRLQLQESAEHILIERILAQQAADKRPDTFTNAEIDAELKSIYKEYGSQKNFFKTIGLRKQDMPLIRETVASRLKLKRMLWEIKESMSEPTQEEVAAFYEAHKKEFSNQPCVHAAHVVKHAKTPAESESAKAEIEKAHAELAGGAEFFDVVERYSDCKSNAGNLGWFERGEMLEGFERVVFDELKPGQISKPFQTEIGWHVATVYEREDGETAPLEEVAEPIKQELKRQKLMDAYDAFLEDLRKQATIKHQRARK